MKFDKRFDFNSYAKELGLQPGVVYYFSPSRDVTRELFVSAVGSSFVLRPNPYLMDDNTNATIRMRLARVQDVPLHPGPDGVRFDATITSLSRGDTGENEPMQLPEPIAVDGLACIHDGQVPGQVYHIWFQKATDLIPGDGVRTFAHVIGM